MDSYEMLAENEESTVVANFVPAPRTETAYQTEAELEAQFISNLQAQCYDYADIRTEEQLISNLRLQIEKLNNFKFSDAEWNVFFNKEIALSTNGIEEKTNIIQKDHIRLLTLDDGSSKNIRLIDKADIHNNYLQVIHQYVPSSETRNRYDVTILVNGLPLVHVELKKRGVDIRDAFNQINRYGRESFYSGSGLFEYIQLFVISNGTYSKYYSNTTRYTHVRQSAQRQRTTGRKALSNTFEFTSYWTDEKNRPIYDLVDFTHTFFSKHTLLNIITKYCVYNVDNSLMVMRPYQIVATEKIINRIQFAYLNKKAGTLDAGGYIWHTTGSGKTLTSFKTAQLATKLGYIDKVLFVVDRQDLDYQTMREYDRFERGAANGNRNTDILRRQMNGEGKYADSKIIITTIQKLSVLVKKDKDLKAYRQNIVLIFDECHRSQFGKMHTSITSRFQNYYIFGFTGTPIFAKNSSSSVSASMRTTAQAFGDRLHTYTIINAITDRNVLPFKIDYIRTLSEKQEMRMEKVSDIDREKILLDSNRISNVVRYIYDHFDNKTLRQSTYSMQGKRVMGFNSIFATASIPAAIEYYNEFKRQSAEINPAQRLRVAMIYSFGVNEEETANGFMDEEDTDSTDSLSALHRQALDDAIADYNGIFGTTFNTSKDKFSNYYKDLSERMKNKEIDILIVVNMFLTGFDAKTLNTLWADKNLKLHGLLQAYSRTNRILNSVKRFGNIISFRNLEKETNESLALFGDENASGVVLLRKFIDYYEGYTDEEEVYHNGYLDIIRELASKFPIGNQIIGLKAKREFVSLFGAYLRSLNILRVFDEFIDADKMTERDDQDYRSIYNTIHEEMRPNRPDAQVVNDDIVFEMELMKSVELNVDYILMLIRKYHESHCRNREIIVKIRMAIESSPDLRDKKELIERFLEQVNPKVSDIDTEWHKYLVEARDNELNSIIVEENLKAKATLEYIKNAFRIGFLQDEGIEFSQIMPPISRFSLSGNLEVKRQRVYDKLKAFFDRFSTLIGYPDEFESEATYHQSMAAEEETEFGVRE